MILCPYCNREAERRAGRTLYPHRPELAGRWFFVCPECDARVGCHARTSEPLGTLANAELRALRARGHIAFDRFWLRAAPHLQQEARTGAYAWIAAELGRPVHFGELREDEARRVLAWLDFHPAPPSVALLLALAEGVRRDAYDAFDDFDSPGGWHHEDQRSGRR